MTTREAASALGLSYHSVLALLSAGKLGHRRMGPNGGKIEIDQRHIDEYRASCEVAIRNDGPKKLKHVRAK